MSALAHWSPICAEAEFLPRLVLQVVKAVPNDDIYVFELTMSLIVHWMQAWFESYPSEPVPVLKAVETILFNED